MAEMTILQVVPRLDTGGSEQTTVEIAEAPPGGADLAARRTGRPFVTTYHGAYGSPGPFKSAYNSVMGRGDRVIANSLYTADLIAARHHVARERIRVIYRGVDLAKFTPEAIAPARLARVRGGGGGG